MKPDIRAWWKEAVVYQIYPRSFAAMVLSAALLCLLLRL